MAYLKQKQAVSLQYNTLSQTLVGKTLIVSFEKTEFSDGNQ
jgi:hypothetical protein